MSNLTVHKLLSQSIIVGLSKHQDYEKKTSQFGQKNQFRAKPGTGQKRFGGLVRTGGVCESVRPVGFTGSGLVLVTLIITMGPLVPPTTSLAT
jgi:hypothetical protein